MAGDRAAPMEGLDVRAQTRTSDGCRRIRPKGHGCSKNFVDLDMIIGRHPCTTASQSSEGVGTPAAGEPRTVRGLAEEIGRLAP